MISDGEIRSQVLQSLRDRVEEHSVCPSEVARALMPSPTQGWRALMPRIRQVVQGLIHEDRVIATRGVNVLPADDLDGGPIRLRRGKRFE